MPSPNFSESEISSELAAIRLTQALIRHGESITQDEFKEIVMINDHDECFARLKELAEKKRLDVDTIIKTKNGGH